MTKRKFALMDMRQAQTVREDCEADTKRETMKKLIPMPIYVAWIGTGWGRPLRLLGLVMPETRKEDIAIPEDLAEDTPPSQVKVGRLEEFLLYWASTVLGCHEGIKRYNQEPLVSMFCGDIYPRQDNK